MGAAACGLLRLALDLHRRVRGRRLTVGSPRAWTDHVEFGARRAAGATATAP